MLRTAPKDLTPVGLVRPCHHAASYIHTVLLEGHSLSYLCNDRMISGFSFIQRWLLDSILNFSLPETVQASCVVGVGWKTKVLSDHATALPEEYN